VTPIGFAIIRLAHPENLVSTQWVAEHLGDPSVSIAEVIWGPQAGFGMPAYEAGQIPGANGSI
jgi:3-mercaptopyruvate sulfurtransferase SseA